MYQETEYKGVPLLCFCNFWTYFNISWHSDVVTPLQLICKSLFVFFLCPTEEEGPSSFAEIAVI